MQNQKATDAIVDLDDAVRWVTALLQERPEKVVDRVLDSEPFVLGLAIHRADRLVKSLRKHKVPEPVLEQIRNKLVIANAYTVELMQKGYRQLWMDVIDPGRTTLTREKGGNHG